MSRPLPEPLVSVARALGQDLCTQIVFIGGLVAPLLQTEPPMPRIRPTDDVDALLVSGGYSDTHRTETILERRGFRRSLEQEGLSATGS